MSRATSLNRVYERVEPGMVTGTPLGAPGLVSRKVILSVPKDSRVLYHVACVKQL